MPPNLQCWKPLRSKTPGWCLLLVPVVVVALQVVDSVRHINPSLHIVARAEGVEQMQNLHAHGVYEVIQPEFEAGLEMTRQALLHLNLPANEIYHYTDQVRQELYAPLYESHADYQAVAQLQNAARLLDVKWQMLNADSPLAGLPRGMSHPQPHRCVNCRVMRDGSLTPNPSVDFRFQPGDWVAVMGQRGAVGRVWGVGGGGGVTLRRLREPLAWAATNCVLQRKWRELTK